MTARPDEIGRSTTGSFESPGTPEASPASAMLTYLRAIRTHLLLIVGIALTTVVAAAAWALQKQPAYEATAKILVSPLPADDPSYVGLPLVRAVGNDSARAVQTAGSLVRSPITSRRTARRLGLSIETVDREVEAIASEDTNIIDVIATSGDRDEAALLADTYADAALDGRRSILAPLVRVGTAQLRAELLSIQDPQSLSAETVRSRLAGLQTIENGKDPTLSLSRAAIVPQGAIGPAAKLVIAVAVLGGLLLGAVVAVLLELLAPRRIADENDLLETYPLPVFTRVPLVPIRRGADQALQIVRERFRTLRARLEVSRTALRDPAPPGLGCVVMITSASRGDGRSTTALNLARACAVAGRSTVIVDLDLARPAIGDFLGIDGRTGLGRLIAPEADPEAFEADPEAALELAVVDAPDVSGLEVVTAPLAIQPLAADALLELMPSLLAQLRLRADWVILDSPPLPAFPAGLSVIEAVDEVVVVARPGNTRHGDLAELRELVGQAKVPSGYVIIGGRAPGSYYGYTGRGSRTRTKPVLAPID